MLQKVFICARVGAHTLEQFEKNQKRMASFARFVLWKGYEPEATGIYYCRFLNDFKPEEREIGMRQGIERLKECKEIWVFPNEDGSYSSGMLREIEIVSGTKVQLKIIDLKEVEEFLKNCDPYGYELLQKSK